MFFQKAYGGINDWWRWVLTTVLTLIGYAIGQIPLTVAIFYYAYKNDLLSTLSPEELEALLASLDFGALGMDLNLALFLALLMFIGMAAALIFFLKVLHQRYWKTLITPFENINWNKIFFSFFLWLAFTVVLEGVSYYMDPEVYTLTFDLKNFLLLFVIIIVLMPIQTSTEELFFRGYLMQGFGLLTRNKLGAILITSLLFSLMHMMNPEVEEFGVGIMFTYYASVGFFLGLITVMDGSLELALGVHAATNMFSALFVSYEGGALKTYAIFNTEVVNVGLMLPIFFVVAAIYFIICWKKYKWEGWRRLLEPIQRPPTS
ncbi:MAG: membrane protease YdiL (CAAX protease family) [Saprospiraceae bacterium]|jgi:membrane protease YdiL (CAAX protease family)